MFSQRFLKLFLSYFRSISYTSVILTLSFSISIVYTTQIYDNIHQNYQEIESPELYAKPEEMNYPIIPYHRLKIIDTLLSLTTEEGGADLNIRKMKHKRHLVDYFPLPDYGLRHQLENEWLIYCKF